VFVALIIQHGKLISITYVEYEFVALAIRHAMRVCHFVICGLSDPKIFFYIISYTTGFPKKKTLLNLKCVFWFFLQILSFQEEMSETWS